MIGTVARRTLAAKARPAAASNETIAVSSQPLPSTVRRAGGTASDRGRGWRTGATRVICRRGTATGSFGTRTGLRAAVRMGLERRTATRRCLAVGCAVRERDAGGTANRVERGGAVARVERGAATRRAAVGGTGATVRCLGRGTTVSAPAEADEDRPRGGAAADGAGSAGAGCRRFWCRRFWCRRASGCRCRKRGRLRPGRRSRGRLRARRRVPAGRCGDSRRRSRGGRRRRGWLTRRWRCRTDRAAAATADRGTPAAPRRRRMPRCTYGWANSGSPDGPTVPRNRPLRPSSPRRPRSCRGESA